MGNDCRNFIKGSRGLLFSHILKEMEEEIACNRWKDLAGDEWKDTSPSVSRRLLEAYFPRCEKRRVIWSFPSSSPCFSWTNETKEGTVSPRKRMRGLGKTPRRLPLPFPRF